MPFAGNFQTKRRRRTDASIAEVLNTRRICGGSKTDKLLRAKHPSQLTDHSVAFARGSFELFPVENLDSTAAILNDFLFLQSLGRKTDARAICSEAGGEKIVRDRQRIGLDTIGCHQQPASQSLSHFMQPVASRSLRHLHSLND